jgi:hypothetical protein
MLDEGMSREEMSREEMDVRALDERVVRALERVPDAAVSIPADFAARVAAKVPASRPVSLTPRHNGRTVMVVSVVGLLVMLLGLAHVGAERSVYGRAVEWLLYAQFLALAVWLGTRSWGLR